MKKELRELLGFILTVGTLTTTLVFFLAALPVQAAGLARSAVVAAANADRALEERGALKEDALLTEAAQAKADDMAAKGYFSHIDTAGRAPWYWFKKVGYYYWAAGENLAVNFDNAQSLEAAWMKSPTHRANILKSNYSRVGIGIAYGMYKGKPATFIVQFFANPYVATKVAVR